MAAVAIDTRLEAEEPLPHGFHNLFVILIIGIIVLWILKVAWQLFRAADLNARLANHQSLQLEGMSIYANDFQMLIRQHFNQILRIRRTVPPKPVPRHSLSIHVHPDSLTVHFSGEGADRAQGAFGVQFTVDAVVPCCVKLYWGVSLAACNEFGRQHAGPGSGDSANAPGPGRWAAGDANSRRQRRQRPETAGAQESTRCLLEMEEINGVSAPGTAGSFSDESQNLFLPGQYIAQSRDFFLPAGQGQRYATPAGDLMDQTQLNIDLSAPWTREGQPVDESAVIPLAIVATAQRRRGLGSVQGMAVEEAQGEVSFVKFRQTAGPRGYGPGIPEIVRQLTFGDRSAHEVQGIFGFEEDEGEGECMICYSRPKNVLLLQCRHCSVCHPCLRNLRDEKCPLCRSVFSSYVTFPIHRSSPSPQHATELPQPPPAGEDNSSSQARAGDVADTSGNAEGSSSSSSNTGAVEAADSSTSDAPGGSEGTRTLPIQVSGSSARQVVFTSSAKSQASSTVRSASQGAPLAQPTEMRSVTPREAPSARPRGTAAAPRTTAQALRLSGRARWSERADTAETPLLQEGGSTPNQRSSEVESEDCRREQANTVSGEAVTEETSILADV